MKDAKTILEEEKNGIFRILDVGKIKNYEFYLDVGKIKNDEFYLKVGETKIGLFTRLSSNVSQFIKYFFLYIILSVITR